MTLLTCEGHCKTSIRIFFTSDNPPISSQEEELLWKNSTPRCNKGTLLFKASSKSLVSNSRFNASVRSWADTVVKKIYQILDILLTPLLVISVSFI